MNKDRSTNQENVPGEYERIDKESNELIAKITALTKQLEVLLAQQRGIPKYQYKGEYDAIKVSR